MYAKYGKRIADMLASMVALIVASPVLLVSSICIWIEDRSPVIFKQRRIGQRDSDFVIYKFRTMPTDTVDLPSAANAKPRVTRTGHVLRRFNLDELPQLINILRGDMSVVGPRPALGSQDELTALRRQSGAWRLKPGLTGLAQVNSYEEMPDAVKAAFDAEYAAGISARQDFAIILKTLRYLLKPPPTY